MFGLLVAKRGIKITRETYFKGARKVGLDSGMLISLVDNANLFSTYILKIDEEEALLFTHEICIKEAVEVLFRDYGWKKEEAEKAVTKFLEIAFSSLPFAFFKASCHF